MKKLNNRGFTLVEVLAIVVILGILVTIIAPNVTTLIEKNKQDSLEQLEKSIKSAAKLYISDHKYEITLVSGNTCNETTTTINVNKIDNNVLDNSQLKIKTLVNEGNLTTNNDGNIYNPANKEKILDLDNSYITIKYDCNTKNYTYDTDLKLEWKTK